MNQQSRTEKAFHWIIDLLENNQIPYQISGGFAARMYGVQRLLFDIDIDIPETVFETIVPLVQPHVVYGPVRHVDEWFDLQLVTLNYGGQFIDLGASPMNLYHTPTRSWITEITDFETFEACEIYGRTVPVIPKALLIRYKTLLGRAVDLEDIAQLL